MEWQFEKERIALAREANGVTQEALAIMTGIKQDQISSWETGKVKPGQDSMMKICNALKTPPQFFYVLSGKNGNIDKAA